MEGEGEREGEGEGDNKTTLVDGKQGKGYCTPNNTKHSTPLSCYFIVLVPYHKDISCWEFSFYY